MKKLLNDKGIITIEASLIFVLFLMGYILINSIALSVHTESNTKKAINSMALELANVSQILDRASLTRYFEKSKASDLLSEITEIGKESISKEGINIDYLLKELTDLFKSTVEEKTKEIAYNALFKRLIKYYFRTEDYLSDKGIVGGYDGLDFKSSRILDNGEIEIVLKYKLRLSGFNYFTIDRNIVQKALISTNIENKSLTVENDNNSVWHSNNFDRGRFFANYIRENAEAKVLKLGQGLDLYNVKTKSVSQFHSMNIFKDSYSSKNDSEYILKNEEIYSQIQKFSSEMQKNIDKLNGIMVLSDDQQIKLPTEFNRELIIVMPNEAKNYDYIKKLNNMKLEDGCIIKLTFMEDAL